MGHLIQIDFRRNTYSLKEARDFLGSGYFRKALLEWSCDELERTIHHPEAFLTDAGLAYTAILRFRKLRETSYEAPVIKLVA